MTKREQRMLMFVRMLVALADDAMPGVETEETVVAANWDILGPRFRSVIEDYADCPNYPI